jgi:hypothetical protein
MSNEKFFNLGLPKWPCLVVMGTKVTKEQAQEIIVRTDSWRFMSNDKSLEKDLHTLAGLANPWEPDQTIEVSQAAWAKDEEVKKAHGVLDLEYLTNSQIVSCYVGGPHGWCNWEGDIFCNDFNIGKWPSTEEVYNEWCLIAKTIPYLDLRCQLMNAESCEEDLQPVIEYVVKGGKVKLRIPTKHLTIPVSPNFEEQALKIAYMSSRTREFGCTMQDFATALALTRLKVSES